MRIERIRAENFKSFEEIDVRPGDVNVLVGPNASGKSNFFSLFRFLRDIAAHGLENAVSMQGGMESLVRFGAETEAINFELGVSFPRETTVLSISDQIGPVCVDRATFQFSLDTSGGSSEISICRQSSEIQLRVGIWNDLKEAPAATVQVEQKAGLLRSRVVEDFEDQELSVFDGVNFLVNDVDEVGKWSETSSSLRAGQLHFVSGDRLISWVEPLGDNIRHQSFLDFEPKLAQRGTPVTGKKDLEEDGSNLALVLNHILRDEERKQKFLRLAHDVLDFIDGIDVDRFADNQLLTHLEEGFGNGSRPIPASMASDGTLSILALIVALYFDDSDVAFIEEPTRNVHPHLAGRIAQMVRDAGRNKQVFATTHNPQFLAGFELDEILLVKRDKEGVSRIERASEDETLKAFLENDVGIDQVFIQNILGQ